MSTNDFGLLGLVSIDNKPTPVEKCDVTNFKLLSEYRRKRAEWLDWYSFRKDEPNNIEGQIIGMIFLDLSYRVLAKPRGNMSNGAHIAARNGILAHMLDQGYVATQVLAIRRLLDRGRKGKEVFSIRRLLDDIKTNRNLITREIFVAYDGTPYEPDGWQSLPPSDDARIFGTNSPAFSGFLRSSERHKMFDKLSGVLPPDRSRKGMIRIEIFERLESWLKVAAAERLVKLSNKFFAHAADLATREGLTYSGVSLKEIEVAQKAIISVERAITDDILFIGESRDVVAMAPLGFLQGLDAAYVEQETIVEMDAHWEELEKERNKWRHAYKAELYA